MRKFEVNATLSIGYWFFQAIILGTIFFNNGGRAFKALGFHYPHYWAKSLQKHIDKTSYVVIS